jgi:hypothetical protein
VVPKEEEMTFDEIRHRIKLHQKERRRIVGRLKNIGNELDRIQRQADKIEGRKRAHRET